MVCWYNSWYTHYMNTIAIVYYSLEGHTKYLAEQLAERLGADLVPIQPKKNVSYQRIREIFLCRKGCHP